MSAANPLLRAIVKKLAGDVALTTLIPGALSTGFCRVGICLALSSTNSTPAIIRPQRRKPRSIS
nr:hypothetical protein [Agrobacterium tumefaciens]